MNKQAIRKAFIVCAVIGAMYAGIAFNVQDRFSMKRTYEHSGKVPRSLSLAVPEPKLAPREKTSPEQKPSFEPKGAPKEKAALQMQKKATIENNGVDIEPAFLIAIPVIAFAINEGFIEKDGMIVVEKDTAGGSSVYLKKPLDILKDKDKDGLKAIARIVGKRNIEVFLNRQGIKIPDKMLPVDTIAGIGYSINKNLLIDMYNTYVGEGFAPLMPYASGGFEVSRKNKGFQIDSVKNQRNQHNSEDSLVFVMPDLSGLSMKAALDKISSKAPVKIYGSGIVVDQSPKPREKIEKDSNCILYGRTYQP